MHATVIKSLGWELSPSSKLRGLLSMCVEGDGVMVCLLSVNSYEGAGEIMIIPCSLTQVIWLFGWVGGGVALRKTEQKRGGKREAREGKEFSLGVRKDVTRKEGSVLSARTYLFFFSSFYSYCFNPGPPIIVLLRLPSPHLCDT